MDYRLGRRPPKGAPALMLGPLLTGKIPAHPASEDYLAALGGGWQMLGNDQYGDCVAVTWANVRRLVTAVIGPGERYPTMADVIEVYKTQNPGFPSQDDGMDIQTLLEWLVSTGGPDGVKALAFAKVDLSSKDEVEAALAIFGFLWTGINVQRANMDDFDAGRPWDYHPGSPVEGGHSVVSGGYTGAASGADERFITWAAETSFTDAFWAREAEEAWVVIWPEHLGTGTFEQGIDQKALADAYTALTGRPFPVAPGPRPDPADAALADSVRVWASARHSGANRRAAMAVEAWLTAKGLA